MMFKLVKQLENILDSAEDDLIRHKLMHAKKQLKHASAIGTVLNKNFPQTLLLPSLDPVTSLIEVREQIEQLRQITMMFYFAVCYHLLDHYQEAVKKRTEPQNTLHLNLQIRDLMNTIPDRYFKAVENGLGQREPYIHFSRDFPLLTQYFDQVMKPAKKEFSLEVERNLKQMSNNFANALNFKETQIQFGLCRPSLQQRHRRFFLDPATCPKDNREQTMVNYRL